MGGRSWTMAVALLAGSGFATQAASVSKSIDVKAPAGKVWAIIGPFCSIKDWHPQIGECTESGGVRTLTLKDGKTQILEKQISSELKTMSYSYTIEKGPFPLSDYKATLKVTPKGDHKSMVEWSSTFTPNPGQDGPATNAIAAIFQAGLDNIQKVAAQ